MTSKYVELSDLAVAHTKARFDSRQRAQLRVKQLVDGYALYLGAPTVDMKFCRMDGNLERTGEVAPLDTLPHLVLGMQGFWHFCFSIDFKRGQFGHFVNEFNKLAIRENGDGSITARMDGKEFKVDSMEPKTTVPLYDHLYQLSKEGLAKPFEEPSKRIGFVETDD